MAGVEIYQPSGKNNVNEKMDERKEKPNIPNCML